MFVEKFENRVKETIKKYDLISKGEKIVVATSGGKDSTTVLYLLKKLGYKVEALIIDLLIGKWSEKNLENLKGFCKENKIKLHVVNMRKEFGCSICYIRSGVQAKTKLGNCTICGVLKRWILNKYAREIGAAKIATGHNLDDEAETVLMNIFTGNPGLTIGLGPKNGLISDKKFVPRIKPLYFCLNEEVRKYSEIKKFPVLYDKCPCSVNTFRIFVRKQLADLEKQDKNIKQKIVDNFLKIVPEMRKGIKGKQLKHCTICGEPSRNLVCKPCELVDIMKN